jgi:demethylmenaquinone methyltransferase/2-methoxy-6-polyprenyl-1,4-benzoquinol methylase
LKGQESLSGTDAGEGAAAPHRPLLSYYAAPEARPDFVRRLFDSTADSYDGINRVLSFGSGSWYRRQALLRAGLKPGARMLDVAIGTGLVAREAVRILGEPGNVIGLDPSAGMLGVAARSLRIRLVQARAEAMPLAEGSMDFLSMGYALRHVSDLALAFAEFRRVLRPGGRLLLLELARPESRVGYAFARAYLGGVVPALSRLAGARSGTLMRYYWDTIDACVPAAQIMQRLRDAGLQEVACRTEFGIFRAYTAQRPPN